MSMLAVNRAQRMVSQLTGQQNGQAVVQAHVNRTEGGQSQGPHAAASRCSDSVLTPSASVCFANAPKSIAGGSKKRGDIAKISLSEEEYDFRIEVDKVKKWQVWKFSERL